MGRVINPEPAGKERNRLVKEIATATRLLMRQTQVDATTRDLAAFIGCSLLAVAATIDKTVEAWEKRDYWLKADRYRMEWRWTEQLGKRLQAAVLEEQWGEAAGLTAQIAAKLGKVEELKRTEAEKPWQGAYQRLAGVNSVKRA
jgi:hypothetical protein